MTATTDRHAVIGARLIVGADGKDSLVRRCSGLDGGAPTFNRWGARRHYQIAPWCDHVEVYWNDGMEAYVTPCGEELVEIAWLWDRDRQRRFASRGDLEMRLRNQFPALDTRLGNSNTVDDLRATDPLQRKCKSPVGEGIALLGDAAGYLDALTGEGISLATAQAIALDRTVGPVLLHGPQKTVSSREMEEFRSEYGRITRPYYALTYSALFLSRHTRMADPLIRALAAHPDIFETLLSVHMGNIPSIRRLCTLGTRLLSDFAQEKTGWSESRRSAV